MFFSHDIYMWETSIKLNLLERSEVNVKKWNRYRVWITENLKKWIIKNRKNIICTRNTEHGLHISILNGPTTTNTDIIAFGSFDLVIFHSKFSIIIIYLFTDYTF